MGTLRDNLIRQFSDKMIPTGDQFKTFITSIISRNDDGIDKSADTALKVMAGKEGHVPVLQLCPKDVIDPQWVLSLLANNREGLNFGQGSTAAHPVLFLDKLSGNIGIGTQDTADTLNLVRDTNGHTSLSLRNVGNGTNTHTILRLITPDGQGEIFKNAATRTIDGGPGTMTVRNATGDLRLQAGGENATITLKSGVQAVGINNSNPAMTLDVNGHATFNGYNIYFPSPSASVANTDMPGLFWHGANFGSDAYGYAMHKTPGGWDAPNYQQLRMQFSTGIQLGAGTGPNAGYGKSYVDIINGRGLMVSSGNLGVGTTSPAGKAHIVTGVSDGNVGEWGTGQLVVGQAEKSGANSGALGFSYHPTNNTAYISALAPGVEWKTLALRSKHTAFLTAGNNEVMRITESGRVGIGTSDPWHPLHLRRDGNGGTALCITNKSTANDAFAIAYLDTDGGGGVMFKNGSGRAADGGPHTMTVRNDVGDLRLHSGSGGLHVRLNTGFVGIGTTVPLSGLSISALAGAKRDTPDANMHISHDTILFGGPNAGREGNSAQISAGRHQANSLNIVGMSDANLLNRRVDFWSEGGLYVRGNIALGNTANAPAPISIYSSGKDSTPDGGLHLNSGTIMLGGANGAGRDVFSASISAGRHQANSLCIVGMSTNPNGSDRRIDFWSDGGMFIRTGGLGINSGLSSGNPRPVVNATRYWGEINGFSNSGTSADDGFLRLSAGAGTSANCKSFIDLSGYSTLPDMNCNIVLGTLSQERMRIGIDGFVGIGTKSAKHKLQVNSGHIAIYASDDGGLQTAGPHANLGSLYFYGHGRNVPNDSARITCGSTGWDDAGYLAFCTSIDWQAAVERMRITELGNVGIGTNLPQSRLSIAGNLTIGAGIAHNTSAPTNGLLVEGDTVTRTWSYAHGGFKTGQWGWGAISSLELGPGTGSPIGNRIIFGTDNTGWKMTIAKRFSGDQSITDIATFNDNGNVGVGTIWPAGKMHVVTSSSNGNVGWWDSGQFVVGREPNSGNDSGAVALSWDVAAAQGCISSLSPSVAWRNLLFRHASAVFLTNGANETFRVHNNGFVGVGHSNPPAPISIAVAGGKEEWPDSAMHITNDCILFGGNNNGREVNSAQISAGKHVANSLCIVGMTADQNAATRRVDMWAEGGAFVHGFIRVDAATWFPWIPSYHYMNQNSVGHYSGASTWVSIWTDYRVVASEFNSISDRRTKTNVTLSDGQNDLSRIRKMEVVKYQYKDVTRKGDTWRLGLVAQQVLDIFPEAVNVSEDFVPDIYAMAESVKLEGEQLTITLEAQHGLTTGDTVRVAAPTGHLEETVEVKDAHTFSINKWKFGDKDIFVYGKKVKDFMVVDYQRVFAMGLSATQEISRQVDVLRAENAALREEIALIKEALGIGGDLPVA